MLIQTIYYIDVYKDTIINFILQGVINMRTIKNCETIFKGLGGYECKANRLVNPKTNRMLIFKSIRSTDYASKIAKYKLQAILSHFENVHKRLTNINLFIGKDVFMYQTERYTYIVGYHMVGKTKEYVPYGILEPMERIYKDMRYIKLSDHSYLLDFGKDVSYKTGNKNQTKDCQYVLCMEGHSIRGTGLDEIIRVDKYNYILILTGDTEFHVNSQTGLILAKDLNTKEMLMVGSTGLTAKKKRLGESEITLKADGEERVTLDVNKLSDLCISSIMKAIYDHHEVVSVS